MPASEHFEQLVLNYAIRGQPFIIGTWWVTFHSESIATAANEVTDLGRALLNWSATANRNANELLFGQVAADVTLRSVVLWDGQTGGNLLIWNLLSPVIELGAGQSLRVAEEALELDVPNL